MNKLALTVFTLIMTSTFLQAAPYEYVERKAWHVQMSAGFSWPADTDWTANEQISGAPSVGANGGGDMDFKLGPGITFATGYTWDNWRFELEYSFRKMGLDRLTDRIEGTTPRLDGGEAHTSAHVIMINVNYDWFFYEKWFWYNGVGLGFAFTNLDLDPSHLGSDDRQDDQDMAFAFQIMTGVGYQVMSNVDVYWGYKFVKITDMDYQYATPAGAMDFNVDGLWINLFEAGVRVRF